MNREDELRPCPFCGSEAYRVKAVRGVESVACRRAGCCAYQTTADAWNKRALPPSPLTEAKEKAVIEAAKKLKVVGKKLDGFDCGHDAEHQCGCGNAHVRLINEWKSQESDLFAALAALEAGEA